MKIHGISMDRQTTLNIGLNTFALQLVAESFADDPERFGDKNLIVREQAHNGQEVFIILTKTMPKKEDFE